MLQPWYGVSIDQPATSRPVTILSRSSCSALRSSQMSLMSSLTVECCHTRCCTKRRAEGTRPSALLLRVSTLGRRLTSSCLHPSLPETSLLLPSSRVRPSWLPARTSLLRPSWPEPSLLLPSWPEPSLPRPSSPVPSWLLPSWQEPPSWPEPSLLPLVVPSFVS